MVFSPIAAAKQCVMCCFLRFVFSFQHVRQCNVVLRCFFGNVICCCAPSPTLPIRVCIAIMMMLILLYYVKFIIGVVVVIMKGRGKKGGRRS